MSSTSPSPPSATSKPLLSPEELESRLTFLRKRVAQPFVRGFADPQPAVLRGGVLIGNKYHAADVPNLVRLGVTAVLNCASGGISRLPVDRMEEQGIRYQFTNGRCMFCAVSSVIARDSHCILIAFGSSPGSL